ncbi:hypothetical protein [Haloarchaeobius sp. HRN-SO-5]|uniref:hypothetical protein n=1 Tax=Haloarchaeobius sp. HRN-SO-5 TaxID=3446118 RepID=UPI003EC14B3D
MPFCGRRPCDGHPIATRTAPPPGARTRPRRSPPVSPTGRHRHRRRDDDRETGIARPARQEVEREVRSVARGRVDVELKGEDRAVAYVDESDISYVIGKGGDRTAAIEDRLGIDIEVRMHGERQLSTGGGDAEVDRDEGRPVEPEFTRHHVALPVTADPGETVEVHVADKYLFTATVGRGGEIQVSRGSAVAEELERAVDMGRRITVVGSGE